MEWLSWSGVALFMVLLTLILFFDKILSLAVKVLFLALLAVLIMVLVFDVSVSQLLNIATDAVLLVI